MIFKQTTKAMLEMLAEKTDSGGNERRRSQMGDRTISKSGYQVPIID
jgi:hypothetical protein